MGWVSVTVQTVPAGMSGLVYGVFWVTEKEPVVAPQVQEPVNGVSPLPVKPPAGPWTCLTIRKVLRENRLVIVQVALSLSARVSWSPARAPPVHDQPWEV